MRHSFALTLTSVTLLSPQAAFAQSKPPPDAETQLDREGELVDPDDLAPALWRSTERPLSIAPVRLSLLAWHQDATPFARDRGLGLLLTFPLERAVAPAFFAQPVRAFAEPSAPAALPFERALGPAPIAPLPPAAAPTDMSGPTPAAFSSAPTPEAAFAALHVPAEQVSALSSAALRAAGLAGATESRLDGLAARAKSSALLPELRLRAMQSNDRALRLSYADADPYRTQTSGGSALLFEARATWRLDRLLFADDEVAVERLRGDLREQRQRVLLKVVEAVATWQKAQGVLFDPEASPRERALAATQAEGASVLLDALSEGAWSRLRARGAGGVPER